MASPVDTSVKIYHSGMVGAPAASGVLGSLPAILDACLVDGWGSRAITGITVAGGIATVSYASAAPPWEADAVVEIAGVTGDKAALNGEQKVLSAGPLSTTFATAVADGAASLSSATIKLKSAGWSRLYAGTNRAVYKSGDVAATGMLCRVDHNSVGARAEIRGYESMTDVDTGTNRFPSAAQNTGGLWMHTNFQNAASTNPWLLVADGRMFFLGIAPYASNNANQYNMRVMCFGDFLPDKSPDPYAAMLCAPSDSATAPAGNIHRTSTEFVSSLFSAAPRDYTGVGTSVGLARLLHGLLLNDYVSGDDSSFGNVYPNNPNNGLLLSRLGLHSGASTTFWRRGMVPGMYFMMQNSRAAFQTLDKLPGNGALAGRKIMAMKLGLGTTAMPNAGEGDTLWFDITGPWR